MASWTDQIPQFNKYVQQLPVEAMVQVGMEKQKRYDEGLQKIQSQIESVAGLDVYKSAHKEYLQSKLNELGNNLRGVAAGDFSNFQLVNSVGGMVNQIIKDPVVKNAYQSTQFLRKQYAAMEEAKKNGKSSPENDWYFTNKVNSWQNDSDLLKPFSDEYIQAYDVEKDILEAMKAAHADSAEWEELARNPDGTINSDILVEKAKKGLLSPKVRNIIDTVFSKPQVQQQLGISGLYSYRDYTPEMIKQTQDDSINYYRDRAKEMKDKLSIVGQISKIDATNANQALLAIDKELQKQEDEYNKFLNLLVTNPDEAKIQLYTQNLRERYTSNFSWEENSQKSKVNPQFTVSMDRANYQLALVKEQFDQMDRNRMYNLSLKADLRAEEELRIKKLISEGKLNPDGSPKFTYNIGAISPEEAAKIDSETFKQESANMTNEVLGLQSELISTLPGYEDVYVERGGVLVPNRAKYSDEELLTKISNAVKELDKAYLNGTIKPNYQAAVSRYYDLSSVLKERNTQQNKIEDQFRPVLQNFNKRLSGIEGLQNSYNLQIQTEGALQNYNVSKDDLVQFYIWRNVPSFGANEAQEKASQSAKDYLVKKFGEKGFENIKDIILANTRKEPGIIGVKGSDNSKLWKVAHKISNAVNVNDQSFVNASQERLEQYRRIQQQQMNVYGTVNTVKSEDKLSINQFYQNVLSNIIGEKSSGEYKKLAEWLNSKKPEELNNNLYDYYKGKNGQWYIQVRRNTGSGYEYSEALPVDARVISQLGVKEDPNEQMFNDKFGGFLNLYKWKQTTEKLNSPDAENSAINRRQIGKYSVGFHLKAFGNGWVPYMYIRDNSGNVLAQGLEVDFSKYANDKSLPAEMRTAFRNAQTIIPTQDVIAKLDAIDEHFIDLMLNNK